MLYLTAESVGAFPGDAGNMGPRHPPFAQSFPLVPRYQSIAPGARHPTFPHRSHDEQMEEFDADGQGRYPVEKQQQGKVITTATTLRPPTRSNSAGTTGRTPLAITYGAHFLKPLAHMTPRETKPEQQPEPEHENEQLLASPLAQDQGDHPERPC